MTIVGYGTKYDEIILLLLRHKVSIRNGKGIFPADLIMLESAYSRPWLNSATCYEAGNIENVFLYLKDVFMK